MEIVVVGPDNKIELSPVIIGRNLGTQVEVLKGLTSSDRIVNSPPDSLANADTVRVAGVQWKQRKFGARRRRNGSRIRTEGALTKSGANLDCQLAVTREKPDD